MSDEFLPEPTPSPPGPEPRAVRDVLGDLARRRGWERRLEGARVHLVWADIAGEELARHVQPVRLAGGVLVVRAESATWATQVRYLAADLAARANDVLGAGSVRTVTVVAGPIEPSRSGDHSGRGRRNGP